MAGLLGEYAESMRLRRFASGTISKRLTVARSWMAHQGAGWVTATWRDVDAYGSTRLISAATWRDEVSHLSHFYRWAMRCDYALADPTVLVERPRVGMRLPRPVSPAQYRRLIDGASPQMLAIIELMAWCGLRCCEVARLRWRDVDLVERMVRVHGKGDRDRDVSLPRRVVRALAAIDGASADDHVVLGAAGLPVTAATVSHLVGRWCQHQRVPVTAHMLRHKFATLLLEAADGDLLTVQHALGHASVATTQIYAQVSRIRAKKVARLLDAFDDESLF